MVMREPFEIGPRHKIKQPINQVTQYFSPLAGSTQNPSNGLVSPHTSPGLGRDTPIGQLRSDFFELEASAAHPPNVFNDGVFGWVLDERRAVAG